MSEINSKYKINVCEEMKEEMEEELEEVMKTFVQLVENFLNKQEKTNIKLTPEIQKYFLILCKESPDLFGDFEQTLKKIISDDRINTKDIPDILVLVSKVYKVINENKGIPMIEPYELIKILLHLTFVVYIETNRVNNSQLLLDLLQIIDSSIELIKLTPIKNINIRRFNCFKC
jgi:hypothetical protein